MLTKEKPGSPSEILEHHGIKGMKWGHRTARISTSSPKTAADIAARSAHRKQVAKKVAIGVGVTAAVVGSAYVAYKLKKSGRLPISPLSNRHPMDIKRLLEKNGNAKISSREWKRYSKMTAADRAFKVKMKSAEALAARNLARSLKPEHYVRDSFGNYIPRSGKSIAQRIMAG